MIKSPVSILYDENGNPVNVILDNSIYRLETRGALVGQTAGAGAEKKVTVIDDVDTATHKRLQVEADFKPGAVLTVSQSGGASVDAVRDAVRETGGSDDVTTADGSVTPVPFTFDADPTDDIALFEIRFVFSDNSTPFGENKFGDEGGGLTNGLLLELTANGGTTVTLAELKVNEDFLALQPATNLLVNLQGARDVITAGIDLGGKLILQGGSGDNVKLTVRDDMTGFQYLKCFVYGVKG